MAEHHKVPVVRIEEIFPHPNADRLEIIRPLGTYQCVVQKGQFAIGDLAIFVPPDSGVPERDKLVHLVDGPTKINTNSAPGLRHIREGVVIKAVPERHHPGLGRAQLKIVSNIFLDKDNKT